MAITTYSNRGNTLCSADPRVTVPIEIVVTDLGAIACDSGGGNAWYSSLDALCEAYLIDPVDILKLPALK